VTPAGDTIALVVPPAVIVPVDVRLVTFSSPVSVVLATTTVPVSVTEKVAVPGDKGSASVAKTANTTSPEASPCALFGTIFMDSRLVLLLSLLATVVIPFIARTAMSPSGPWCIYKAKPHA
jgi:hypothetical protein